VSEYPVLGDVDTTLRDLLWSQFQNDAQITAIIGSDQKISFEPPFRLFKDDTPQDNMLSLFLYRIVENVDLKNRPLLEQGPGDYRYPPLAINLFYLITPLTNSSPNDHMLLGKIMQILYDHGSIQGSDLRGLLKTNTEELRIVLNPMSLEDSTKLWCAFLRCYRLSVCYAVRVVLVDSERTSHLERVRRKRLQFEQVQIQAS